jgi:hypothetical protein
VQICTFGGRAVERSSAIRWSAILAVIAALGLVAAEPATPAQIGVVCGQIRTGPYASFSSSLVTGLKLKGTTWTVVATGLPCATAMKATPRLLRQWAKAKIGAPLALSGMHCLKLTDRAYGGPGESSGGFVCGSQTGTPYLFAPKTFAARMTGGWSVARIKQTFGLG